MRHRRSQANSAPVRRRAGKPRGRSSHACSERHGDGDGVGVAAGFHILHGGDVAVHRVILRDATIIPACIAGSVDLLGYSLGSIATIAPDADEPGSGVEVVD